MLRNITNEWIEDVSLLVVYKRVVKLYIIIALEKIYVDD